MHREEVNTYRVSIHMAGDPQDVRRICKCFVYDNQCCVTVKEQEFIYKGGQERGVEIGLVQYPRFPKKKDDIFVYADSLAQELIEQLGETSALIVADDTTRWIHRRESN